MPIGAFQKARLDGNNTAIVPSLYAMRADGKNRFVYIPEEGPLLIPSCLCAGMSIPEETEVLFCPELRKFYEKNGALLVYPACSEGNRREKNGTFFFCQTKSGMKRLRQRSFMKCMDSCIFNSWFSVVINKLFYEYASIYKMTP